MNIQPILNCFVPNFKYENSENVKGDRVNTVVLNVNQTSGIFLGHPVVRSCEIEDNECQYVKQISSLEETYSPEVNGLILP